IRGLGRVEVGARGDREGGRVGEDPGAGAGGRGSAEGEEAEEEGRRGRIGRRDRPRRSGRTFPTIERVTQCLCRGLCRPERARSGQPAARRARRQERTMVSAAEQLAANLNFSALAKAEELKKRIWFTVGALLVYR